jgi:TPR repeat protein
MSVAGFASFAVAQTREELRDLCNAVKGPMETAAPARAKLERYHAEGNRTATLCVGQMHVSGGAGMPKDEKKGVALLTQSAEAGEPDAMRILGALHQAGALGVKQDNKAAVAWLEKAAAAGHPEAALELGKAYYSGNALGLDKNLTKALTYLEQAAPAYPAIANHVAVLYGKTLGAQRNEEKAIHFWKLAAKGGVAAAQQELDARKVSWR